MKIRTLFIVLFLWIPLVYSNNSLKEVRTSYFKVNSDEISLDEFEELLNQTSNTNIEIQGYKTMLWFLKAKDYYNPLNKLEAFNKGRQLLEKLLIQYPDNLELHFLRLTIQDHAPSFLGYNDHIKKDEQFITLNINQLSDSDLKNRVLLYLKEGRNQ